MTDYLVGTGGWSYFNVPNKPALKAYGEIFNFVEVNYTFYEYPTVQTVERWRRTVPKDFTFSVRCHQDLTHKIGLKPVDEAYEAFYKIKTYAEIAIHKKLCEQIRVLAKGRNIIIAVMVVLSGVHKIPHPYVFYEFIR